MDPLQSGRDGEQVRVLATMGFVPRRYKKIGSSHTAMRDAH